MASLVLTPIVLQLIQMGLSIVPEIVAAARAEVDLLNAGSAPTAEQQAAIDAALDQAHAALQAAQPGG